MEQSSKLTPTNGKLLPDPSIFRRLVGRLIYLIITRPNIVFSVNLLSQFMHEPRIPHMDAAYRILRYLKGTLGHGILLSPNCDLQLYGYCDSDWASYPTTRRSTTGNCIFLGHSPISWRTKKQQQTMSKSSAKVEYRSMAHSTCEITWLHYLLQDLGVPTRHPTILFCENQATHHIAANPVYHERTKHIEIDCHIVCGKIQEDSLKGVYVHTSSQLADVFTIPFSHEQLRRLMSKLGLIDLHAPT